MRIYETSFPVPTGLMAKESSYETEVRVFRGHDHIMFRNAPRTLNEVLEKAFGPLRDKADERITEQDGIVTTFGEFEARTAALSQTLRSEMDIQAGEHVAIAMANRVEWMMSFVAILAAGAVPVLVNSRGAGAEIQHAITASDCVAALCDQERFDHLTSTGQLPVPIMLLGKAADGTLDFATSSEPQPDVTLTR